MTSPIGQRFWPPLRHVTLGQIILQKLDRIMTALDDLAAAEADEEAVLTALLSDIQTLTAEVAAIPAATDTDAAVEAVVAKMKAAQDAARAALAPPASTST